MRHPILSLALLALAAAPGALAQGAVDGYEIDVDVATQTRLNIYKSDGSLLATFLIDPTPAEVDWTADFNGDSADWSYPWLEHDAEFLTLEFKTPAGALLKRYVYVPANIAYPAGITTFFRPQELTYSVDLRIEVAPGPTVRARPADKERFYEDSDIFGTGAYVIPYNYGRYCSHDPQCNPAAPIPAGHFLTPVDYLPNTTTRRFTFSSSPSTVLIRADWPEVSWNVPNLELRFPGLLVVQGGRSMPPASGSRSQWAAAAGPGSSTARRPAGPASWRR